MTGGQPDYYGEFRPTWNRTGEDSTEGPSEYSNPLFSENDVLSGSPFTTSASESYEQDYQAKLPDKLNVFKSVDLGVVDKAPESVKKQLVAFLRKFNSYLNGARELFNNSGNLPSLMVNILEDGSALVEWGFKDFRIGFAFEVNPEESSWYAVSNQKFQEASASGKLKDKEMEDLILPILTFVASNT